MHYMAGSETALKKGFWYRHIPDGSMAVHANATNVVVVLFFFIYVFAWYLARNWDLACWWQVIFGELGIAVFALTVWEYGAIGERLSFRGRCLATLTVSLILLGFLYVASIQGEKCESCHFLCNALILWPLLIPLGSIINQIRKL